MGVSENPGHDHLIKEQGNIGVALGRTDQGPAIGQVSADRFHRGQARIATSPQKITLLSLRIAYRYFVALGLDTIAVRGLQIRRSCQVDWSIGTLSFS